MRKICFASSRQLSQTLWRSTASGARLPIQPQVMRYAHDDSTFRGEKSSSSPLVVGSETSRQDPDASHSIAIQNDLGISDKPDRAFRSGPATRLNRDVLREAFVNAAVPEHTRMVAQQLFRSYESSGRIFNECVLRGDIIPYETIELCLYCAHRSHRHRPHLVQEPIAAPILKYILKSPRRWLPFVTNPDSTPGLNLCFFALVEGREDLVRDWILTETTEDKIFKSSEETLWKKSATQQRQDSWRANLFQSLVKAHLDRNPGVADKAILCFFRVISRKFELRREAGIHGKGPVQNPEQEKRGAFYFSTWTAARTIIKRFSGGALKSTDAGTHEKFERLVRGMGLPPKHIDWADAVLALHRPGKPYEQKSVELLRKLMTERENVSSLPQLLLQNNMMEEVKKAHEVALQNGNTENAEWLSRTFQEVLDASTPLGDRPARPRIRYT